MAQYKSNIAKIDRSTWPYKIDSASEFDYASQMEMLVFSWELNKALKIKNIDSLKQYLRIKSVNQNSIYEYSRQIKGMILQNFKQLDIHPKNYHIKLSEINSWNDILTNANNLETKLPTNLLAWYNNSSRFYSKYVGEQLRLAGLFPSITSEILKLDNTESTGVKFQDKEFLLSFDDGPTAKGGNTDKLIEILKQYNKNAIFFVLGKNFETRSKLNGNENLKNLYRGFKIGSHGNIHKAHPRYQAWKHSIAYTDSLINRNINRTVKYFRPPYGQRNSKIIEYLKSKNQSVMLWNIDSQDWNSKINSKEVADRIISLMLVWRKGILLFHDIHSKSKYALPIVWKQLEQSSINWK
jgi:peptidoglycan/xylan/chitin deacetylase (PgdA/CDA1 family)